eukprot:scaffold6363_cov98-Skeletonema_menzelii.AAC.1
MVAGSPNSKDGAFTTRGAQGEQELASWGSTSSCTYNGTVLSIVPGMFGYNTNDRELRRTDG